MLIKDVPREFCKARCCGWNKEKEYCMGSLFDNPEQVCGYPGVLDEVKKFQFEAKGSRSK